MAHRILLSSTCRRGVPHGRTATASALPLLRCFRGPRREARLPTNAPAAATQNGRMAQGQSPGAGHDGAGGSCGSDEDPLV